MPPHRPPSRRSRFPLLLLFTLTVGFLLLPIPVDAARKGLPSTWPERVEELDRMLRDGKYGAAERKARLLVEEMAGILLAGEGSDRALGKVLALHAVALSGEGEESHAEWTWYLAQSLNGDLAKLDLTGYGEAGARLEATREEAGPAIESAREAARRRQARKVEAQGTGAETGDGVGSVGGIEAAEGEAAEGEADGGRCEDLTSPVKRKAPHPSYPPALRAAGIEGPVVLSLILDEEGQLTRPVLLEAPTPGLAWVVAETAREWVFEPARCAGEAKSAYYVLQVNMSLGR